MGTGSTLWWPSLLPRPRTRRRPRPPLLRGVTRSLVPLRLCRVPPLAPQVARLARRCSKRPVALPLLPRPRLAMKPPLRLPWAAPLWLRVVEPPPRPPQTVGAIATVGRSAQHFIRLARRRVALTFKGCNLSAAMPWPLLHPATWNGSFSRGRKPTALFYTFASCATTATTSCGR
jgi:hypothetical protein